MAIASNAAGPNPLPLLALVRDLIFATRITAMAADLKRAARVIRDPALLRSESAGGLLLVDLNLEGAIEAAITWKAATGGTLVGFVSHVDAETIRRARSGGFDQVLARSAFIEKLPELLGR